MKEQFRFKEFTVYQDAKRAYGLIIELTKLFTFDSRELADQLRRAALSICLNIAEGSAKQSDKDFRRYLLNALGSTNEVMAGLDIAEISIPKIGDKTITITELYVSIGRQLGGMCKKLQS